MPVVETSESRDGTGAGDHDVPYHPRERWPFKPFELMHLLMMRGLVQDHRAGVRGGAAEGDDELIVTTLLPSGLYVPVSDNWKDEPE